MATPATSFLQLLAQAGQGAMEGYDYGQKQQQQRQELARQQAQDGMQQQLHMAQLANYQRQAEQAPIEAEQTRLTGLRSLMGTLGQNVDRGVMDPRQAEAEYRRADPSYRGSLPLFTSPSPTVQKAQFGWVRQKDGSQKWAALTPGTVAAPEPIKPDKPDKPQYGWVTKNGKRVYSVLTPGMESEPETRDTGVQDLLKLQKIDNLLNSKFPGQAMMTQPSPAYSQARQKLLLQAGLPDDTGLASPAPHPAPAPAGGGGKPKPKPNAAKGDHSNLWK